VKDKLLKEIRSRGYWRILFEPLELQNIDSPIKCKQLVKESSVHLRGWPFPHCSDYSKEGEFDVCVGDSFAEGWTSVDKYRELWRLFQSGQFINNQGLREDWSEGVVIKNMWRTGDVELKPMEKLGLVSTVFLITEIYQFLSRLCQKGLYNGGVKVSISLNNTNNRELFIEQMDRVPFSSPKKTLGDPITFEKIYFPDEILSKPNELALITIVHFFQRFDWENPNVEVIKKDQERLIKGL